LKGQHDRERKRERESAHLSPGSFTMHGASRQRQTRRFPSVRSPHTEICFGSSIIFKRETEREERRGEQGERYSLARSEVWPIPISIGTVNIRIAVFYPIISNKFDYEIIDSTGLNIQDISIICEISIILSYLVSYYLSSCEYTENIHILKII